MLMRYVTGDEAEDRLFDLSITKQRAYVAAAMNCNPAHPEGWPVSTIDGLIELRRRHGKEKFYVELGRILSPHL